MRWSAQAVHVARKDVRLMRWFLLAYAAVVLATTIAVVFLAPRVGPAVLATAAIIVLGHLLIAVAIQEDSPAAVDAFWATRPVDPGAVMAGKLLVAALVLLGLPLLGQLVALLAFDPPAAALPALLLESVAMYGGWLLAAAAIASVTPDLKTFITAMIVLVVVSFAATMTFDVIVGTYDSRSARPGWLTAVLPAAWLGVVLHQYWTRATARGRWLAAAVALVSIALPWAVTAAGASDRPEIAPAAATSGIPEQLRPSSLRIIDVGRGSADELHITLEAQGRDPRYRYVLADPSLRIETADGTARHLRHLAGREVSLGGIQGPEGLPVDSVAWLNEPGLGYSTSRYRSRFSAELPDEAASLLSGDGAALVLEGQLRVLEARVRVRLPVREGATRASERRMIRIEDVTSGPGGPALTLLTTGLVSDAAATGPLMTRPDIGYLLIRRDLDEGVVLQEGSGSGFTSGLVLPGPTVWSQTRELISGRRPRERRPDVDWLRGAELVVLEWEPVATAGIRMRITESAVDHMP